ncbi:MAG: hypothetical protein M3N95_02565 [Actinomycetota bacterium]|nr:hypothetical protein [Actinomycetota bacterium]
MPEATSWDPAYAALRGVRAQANLSQLAKTRSNLSKGMGIKKAAGGAGVDDLSGADLQDLVRTFVNGGQGAAGAAVEIATRVCQGLLSPDSAGGYGMSL